MTQPKCERCGFEHPPLAWRLASITDIRNGSDWVHPGHVLGCLKDGLRFCDLEHDQWNPRYLAFNMVFASKAIAVRASKRNLHQHYLRDAEDNFKQLTKAVKNFRRREKGAKK